ncbi:MAG: hypothetical protein IT174_16465 [Acidobacteria bacterium]|nr:hypothetical protein [Acidobacteriota bacterium]
MPSIEAPDRSRLWVISDTRGKAAWLNAGFKDIFEVETSRHVRAGARSYSARTAYSSGLVSLAIGIGEAALTLAAALRKLRAGDQILIAGGNAGIHFVGAAASLIRGGSFVLLLSDGRPTRDNAVSGALQCGLAFLNRWIWKYAAALLVLDPETHERVCMKSAGLDVPVVTVTGPESARLRFAGGCKTPRSDGIGV